MSHSKENACHPLSREERLMIAQYKKSSAHLPKCGKLADYIVPDFDELREDPDLSLSRYVRDLSIHSKILTRAAKDRDVHFRVCIKGKKREEPKHRAWRQGMLSIAKDARNKLKRWSKRKVDMRYQPSKKNRREVFRQRKDDLNLHVTVALTGSSREVRKIDAGVKATLPPSRGGRKVLLARWETQIAPQERRTSLVFQ